MPIDAALIKYVLRESKSFRYNLIRLIIHIGDINIWNKKNCSKGSIKDTIIQNKSDLA